MNYFYQEKTSLLVQYQNEFYRSLNNIYLTVVPNHDVRSVFDQVTKQTSIPEWKHSQRETERILWDSEEETLYQEEESYESQHLNIDSAVIPYYKK